MGGVLAQGAGAATVGAGAAMSATGIGAVVGVPTMAVGGTVIAVGEGVQLVSLGADVGMIVWDKQGESPDRAANCSSVSSTCAAPTFSSRCATRPVPGIGSMTGERRSSQASAS